MRHPWERQRLSRRSRAKVDLAGEFFRFVSDSPAGRQRSQAQQEEI
jgi:hypothetical protein